MIEQVSVAAPREVRLLGIVVTRIVILGHGNGQALFLIPQVFLFQGPPVVLEVAEDEETAVIRRTDDVDAVFDGPGEDVELRRIVDLDVVNRRMPRLGDEVTVIEAPQEGMVLLGQLVFKDTEELGRQETLFDAIVVIQGCLGAPAKVERREGMCLGPFKEEAKSSDKGTPTIEE